MYTIADDLYLNAIDLGALDLSSFERDAMPMTAIPQVKIRVKDYTYEAAIASWRHDIQNENEISDNLKKCIMEAKQSGFLYLLVDIISIEQDSDEVVQQVVAFSNLYTQLRSIISYEIDDDLRRPWLRNEALRILNSPTRLGYALTKWQPKLPLRPSLVIRQVCNRRLGITNPNLGRLKLCDAYAGMHMVLSDLEIRKTTDPDRPFTSINLDLRHQRYASDILLIFEINRSSVREALVRQLVPFKSNSVVVPALVGIWACAEGLSVSFRWSDWDSDEILARIERIIFEAATSVDSRVTLDRQDDGWHFRLEGEVVGNFSVNIVKNEYLRDVQTGDDLMIRCSGSPLLFSKNLLKEVLLANSVAIAIEMRNAEHLSEEISEKVFENRGGIMFDDYSHHEDIYDLSKDTRQMVSPFVSVDDLEKFESIAKLSIIQEHVHFRIDINILERAVRELKAESHRMVLLYLCAASENNLFLDLAMAISDLWWFVYDDKQLQIICNAVATEIQNGNTISEEDVMPLLKKVYMDDGRQETSL